MDLNVGAHVDESDPINQAQQLGVGIVQISLGDPKSWRGPVVNYPGGAAGLRQAAQDAGITIYVHAPFVINVASTNNRIRIPSRKLLQQHLSAANEIGAAGLIVHGGHVTQDDDPEQGYDNWLKAVDGLQFDQTPLLLENTAGGKRAMLRFVDAIEQVWRRISESENIDHVGFCYDTCHGFASGNNFVGLADEIRSITGRIDLVHLNDSKGKPGSGVDRHEQLGRGEIDPADLVAEWQAANAPAVLETPSATHAADLAWLSAQLG